MSFFSINNGNYRNMKYNFCTLFDSHYLIRGLAMYQSLAKHLADFHLYIYPFDDECLKVLRKLDLPNVTLVPIQDLKDEEFLKIKDNRNPKEYCWTGKPCITRHALINFNLESITYIDADLYFFYPPEAIIDELGNDAILITEHRFPADEDKSRLTGKYCSQLITFKNNAGGWQVLDWWRKSCLQWCYDKYEDGKFGDQKYLDDWTTRFTGVHELQHLGGGVAIWNVNNYNITKENNNLWVREKNSAKVLPLIFYHFHGVRLFNLSSRVIVESTQFINKDIKKLIYLKYSEELTRAWLLIKTVRPEFKLGFSKNLIYFRKLLGKFLPAKLKKLLKTSIA